MISTLVVLPFQADYEQWHVVTLAMAAEKEEWEKNTQLPVVLPF